MKPINKRKILISGAIAAFLSVGYLGFQNDVQCLISSVDIKYGENRFCGSQQEYDNNKTISKQRLQNNEVSGESEYALMQLMVRNDQQFSDEVKNILLSKYDVSKKQFVGTKFDSDVIYQMALLVDIADMKCNGSCQLNPNNLTEDIYNLISQ